MIRKPILIVALSLYSMYATAAGLVTFTANTPAKASEVNNNFNLLQNQYGSYGNVALSSLGAVATANGSSVWNGVDHIPSFAIDGFTQIDGFGNPTAWYGNDANYPLTLTIDLPKTYVVDRIYIKEHIKGYINTGTLEYFDGSTWNLISNINKSSESYYYRLPLPVFSNKIRLTINTSTTPPSWIHRVPAIETIAVYAIGEI